MWAIRTLILQIRRVFQKKVLRSVQIWRILSLMNRAGWRAAAKFLLASFVLCGAAAPQSFAQHAAEPSARYYRVIAMVHLNGPGKKGDPILPEYVPQTIDPRRQGIIAWSLQLTDDKKMAIVHMVAVNHHAFDAILADKRPEVKVFEIGKDSKAAIEGEMQKHKSGFDLSKFQVVAR